MEQFKRIFSVSLFLIAVSACGTERTVQAVSVDERAVGAIERFESVTGKKVTGITVQFAPVIERKYTPTSEYRVQLSGLCAIEGTARTITISEAAWESHAGFPLEQEALIVHELGHCVLNLDHTANGIMRASPNVIEYAANPVAAINDLLN